MRAIEIKSALILGTIVLLSNFVNAQWVQTNGPLGGAINAIAISDNNIFVGTNVGIFASKNKGKTWTIVNSFATNISIKSLFFHGGKLYAGTLGHGVFLSTDEGARWTEMNSDLPSDNDASICSFALNDSDLFAAVTGHGIFRLPNGSVSWGSVNTNYKITETRVLTANDRVIVAGTGRQGIFRSINKGNTWTEADSGLPDVRFSSLSVIGDRIFTGVMGGFFVSPDTCTNWSNVMLNAQPINRPVAYIFGSEHVIFAGGPMPAICSTDNGTSWTMANGFGGTNAIVFAASGGTIAAGENGNGISVSTDNGASWSASNNMGLINMGILSVAGIGSAILASTDDDVYHSTDNGAHWIKTVSGITDFTIGSFLVNGSTVFNGCGGGVFFSNDNGISWNNAEIDKQVNLESSNINAITMTNGVIFAGMEQSGLLFSTDNGIHWAQVNSDLASKCIRSLASDSGTIAAETDSGEISVSTDNGGSWVRVNARTAGKLFTVNHDTIFASDNSGGIFRSTYNGASWETIAPVLTDKIVRSCTVYKGSLFAGTDSGVFHSKDNGNTWRSFNVGLSNESITSLAVQGKFFFAGTAYRGVWRRPLSELTWVTSSGSPRTPFAVLSPNNKPQEASIAVYNSTGRKIGLIANNHFVSGLCTRNAVNGFYIVSMQTGLTKCFKKISVVK